MTMGQCKARRFLRTGCDKTASVSFYEELVSSGSGRRPSLPALNACSIMLETHPRPMLSHKKCSRVIA